jgi:transcriptional regulator GlxA family with amidase domain
VPARDRNRLRAAEQQALVLIREVHHKIAEGDISAELKTPARLAHYVITVYHGHAQLRMSRIAPELGVTMRTLERSFRRIFHTSMRDYQIQTRLNFARHLLSSNPDLKMSVIAKHLGYDDPNVFGRFFRDHADDSPHAWSEAQQARRLQKDSGNGNSNG